MPREHVQPHPLLPKYYATLDARDRFVRTLFNRTAVDYDRINRIFSFGSGSWYRRDALRRAGLSRGATLLDVATGTGLVAKEAVRVCGHRQYVTGLDISENMLAIARDSLGISAIQGRAEELPIAEASMDFVSMGYALRHVSDLRLTFGEFRRVLKPGGTALLLEIGRPESLRAHGLARIYLGRIVPTLCQMLHSGSEARNLMRYYWDTIEACVTPPVILGALTRAGFERPVSTTSMGIFRAYVARKPLD
jgi:demethylmenaquinone methyltransferase / 2-methoxy-6-polyprenyl-1,4-benzoquinol methylase